jgi:D-alanyl-D-alanine dipeptidase
MWKIAVGFAIFAAVALFALMKAGDKVDMGGEKHEMESHSTPAKPSASAPAAAPAAAPSPAPAASAPATPASAAP